MTKNIQFLCTYMSLLANKEMFLKGVVADVDDSPAILRGIVMMHHLLVIGISSYRCWWL